MPADPVPFGDRQGDVGLLYPFLSDRSAADPGGATEELCRSTAAKIAEIAALRDGSLELHGAALDACAAAVADRVRAGGRVLAFGNGGSSTDAQALVERFGDPHGDEPAVPAIALSSAVAVVTALANDVGFDVVYSRQLATLGRATDVAIALSTSGNSPNVVRALGEARGRGLLTVGFAGHDGGQMAHEGVVDHLFVVPSASVHRIQEAQTTLYHVLVELTRRRLREMTSRT